MLNSEGKRGFVDQGLFKENCSLSCHNENHDAECY